MSKRNFRAGHQGSLPSASVQGNQLLLTGKAAEQAWEDMKGMHQQCVAMCTAPGIALQYRNEPSSAQLDQKLLATRMQAIANQLEIKQRELGNLKVDLEKGARQNHPDPSDRMVACLDMSMRYNEWVEAFHKTVMVAVDDFLQLYRDAPLRLAVPFVSGHYQAFSPTEVLNDPGAPVVGEHIPKSAH